MRRFTALRLGPHREAVDHDLAAVGAPQPLDHLERRRLAGAVGPEDAEDLAALHAQGDAVDRHEVAVALGQALDG